MLLNKLLSNLLRMVSIFVLSSLLLEWGGTCPSEAMDDEQVDKYCFRSEPTQQEISEPNPPSQHDKAIAPTPPQNPAQEQTGLEIENPRKRNSLDSVEPPAKRQKTSKGDPDSLDLWRDDPIGWWILETSTEQLETDVPGSSMESLEPYQGRIDLVDERFLPPALYDEVKQADPGPQTTYKSSYDEWTVADEERPEYLFEEPLKKGAPPEITKKSTERLGTDVPRSSKETLKTYQARIDPVDERFLPSAPYDEVKQAYPGPQTNYKSSYNEWTVADEERPEYLFEEPLKKGALLEITKKSTERRGTDVPRSSKETLKTYQGKFDIKEKYPVDEMLMSLDTSNMTLDEIKNAVGCSYAVAHKACGRLQKKFKSTRLYSFNAWTEAHEDRMDFLLKGSLKNVEKPDRARRIEEDFAEQGLPEISRPRIRKYIRKREEYLSQQNINNNDV